MHKESPFQTNLVNNQIILTQNYKLHFTHKKFHKWYTYIKGGVRIGKTAFAVEKPLKGTENAIIKQIHHIRYSEKNPYLITGGHFSQLFVRNLGVFFNALLDPRIPGDNDDWLLRQAIALKTVAHDMELFHLARREYTTITQIRKHLYTGLDIYARPSDSLFAIVYTLNALTDSTFIEKIFPAAGFDKKQLQTQQAATKLVRIYGSTLRQLLQTYITEIIDPNTGLIKTNLLLASARDGIKRQSSFYDNVIAWATVRLAKKLNLYTISKSELEAWKERIIKTFWDASEGIFIDDLSEESKNQKLFSADSFIVLSTGFLNFKLEDERNYLNQMILYVKKNKLDEPFPLHYSTSDLPEKLYRPVRHFAPAYMGTSIWSHWGMEYIKTLIYVSKFENTYKIDAQKHLDSYKKNILHYGGYPEVYNSAGKLLKTRLYRSVLHNGWVINYEQTKILLKAAA